MLRTLARWLGYDLVARRNDRGERRSLENPAVSLQDPEAWEELGWIESSDAGESVTAAKMLGCPAVWQAVGMISGDVSKLPLEIYERDGDGRRSAYEHPAWMLVSQAYGRANPETSSLLFWRRLLVHALIWPRGWAWIERDNSGRPLGLYHLLPDRTWYARIRDRLWVVSDVGGRMEAFGPDDVLVIENVSIDESDSFGPLRAARQNIGLQLAQRKFNSRFYSHGCHAGGILQVPPGASDKAIKKVQESIEAHRSGGDESFRALVLRDGFKWHQTTISPDDAQAGETAEAEVRNVARFYRLAPSRLGVSESISYNSEEAARRAYHDETLSYWLTQIKSECNLKLLTEEQRIRRTHFVDYNVAALLWADTATVISVGSQGVQWGIFNRDEVRGWFNLNPIPGGAGAKFLVPLNLAVAGDDPPPAGEDDQQRAAVIAAVRQLARDTATRICGRLGLAAVTAHAWLGEFAATLEDRHGATCREMWAPVRQLAEACGFGTRDAVAEILAEFRAGLGAIEEPTRESVQVCCDRVRRETPARIAESFPGNRSPAGARRGTKGEDSDE